MKLRFKSGVLTSALVLACGVPLYCVADSATLISVFVSNAKVGTGIVSGGTAYIPARVVSESLGAQVDYNRFTQRIDVTPTGKTAPTLVSDEQSLTGLQGVCVAVESFRSDAEKDGLVAGKVKQFVTDRLKNAKVPVLTDEQVASSPGRPVLYININPIKQSDASYSYSVAVEVITDVLPAHKPAVMTRATIWNISAAGSIGSARLPELQESVGSYIDSFIAVYTKANPT